MALSHVGPVGFTWGFGTGSGWGLCSLVDDVPRTCRPLQEEPDDGASLVASILYSVSKICDAEGAARGLVFDKPFKQTVAHVVLGVTQTLGTDLECFAQHGKRSTINYDDVLLCARRNPDLLVRWCRLATHVHGAFPRACRAVACSTSRF